MNAYAVFGIIFAFIRLSYLKNLSLPKYFRHLIPIIAIFYFLLIELFRMIRLPNNIMEIVYYLFPAILILISMLTIDGKEIKEKLLMKKDE